ncbi:MAG: hypothetical protein F6J93_22145 [Oscillatoria sp. SIO1A7]|nr:hypothetical protein [Oscillatoria sp. SIO1A7]
MGVREQVKGEELRVKKTNYITCPPCPHVPMSPLSPAYSNAQCPMPKLFIFVQRWDFIALDDDNLSILPNTN